MGGWYLIASSSRSNADDTDRPDLQWRCFPFTSWLDINKYTIVGRLGMWLGNRT
jgi:hypothetical protein